MKKLLIVIAICIIAVVVVRSINNARITVERQSYYDFMQRKQVTDVVASHVNDPQKFTQCRRVETVDYVEVWLREGSEAPVQKIVLKDVSSEERAKWNKTCEEITNLYWAHHFEVDE